MYESDWDGWKLLIDCFGKKVQLVGDDLFVMNMCILKEGIEKGIVNLIFIKINQIGMLIEMFVVIEMVKCVGYMVVILYCLGEMEDLMIVDIVVGLNVGQIKMGLLLCSDCILKYNQLLCIEEDFGDIVSYLGKLVFYNLC